MWVGNNYKAKYFENLNPGKSNILTEPIFFIVMSIQYYLAQENLPWNYY